MTIDATGTSDTLLLRIGEVAEHAGVSPRTLRYYEELGLLAPSGHSAGGARRYATGDVARLLRIRELQELLGFDLGEIGVILRAEDQLADLRRQFHGGAGIGRRRAIVAEAMDLNSRMRGLVRTKQERLDEMMRDLDAKARRYRSRARELAAPERAAAGRVPAAQSGTGRGASSRPGASRSEVSPGASSTGSHRRGTGRP